MSKKEITPQDENKDPQRPEAQKDNPSTDVIDVTKIPTLLTQVDALLNKTYLPMLSQLDIISLDTEEISFTKINSNIRFLKLNSLPLSITLKILSFKILALVVKFSIVFKPIPLFGTFITLFKLISSLIL